MFFINLYKILTILFYPFILLYLNYRKKIGKEDIERFKERLGFSEQTRPKGFLIWVHAASIGESLSVLPLLNKIKSQLPQVNILFTSGTKTSAEIIKHRIPKSAIHQFVPIDTYFSVKRFLNKWKPDLILWTESELWPTLLTESKNQAPILLLNARMSENSYIKWSKYKFFLKPILECFSIFFPQSKKDAEFLSLLGAKNIIYKGNLKYDALPLPCSENAKIQLQGKLKNRQIILAASTHKGEEDILFDVYKKLKKYFPNLLFMIVPRDPSRRTEIMSIAKDYSLKTSLRSNDDEISEDVDIYIADTIGELGIFYRIAEISFIGGSIVPHGGQNPLEAARLGCCLLFGPHMFNFSDIVNDMLENEAAIVVKDKEEIFLTIKLLLDNKESEEKYIKKAYKIVEKNNNISEEILKEIQKFIQ